MSFEEPKQIDDSNDLDVSVNPYDDLHDRYESIKNTLYDNPSESFDELLKICFAYCRIDSSEEKIDHEDIFLQAIDTLHDMIKKYRPTNQEKLDELFDSFYTEDEIIRSQSNSENYNDIVFDHYLAFTNNLDNEIEEIIYSFPKYSADPIDTRILFVLTIMLIIFYIVLKIKS